MIYKQRGRRLNEILEMLIWLYVVTEIVIMVISVDPLSMHNPCMLMAYSKIHDSSNSQIKKRDMPLFFFLSHFQRFNAHF